MLYSLYSSYFNLYSSILIPSIIIIIIIINKNPYHIHTFIIGVVLHHHGGNQNEGAK